MISGNNLSIDALPKLNKSNIKVNPNSHCIPKHPARVLFNGSSASGKTNLIITMLVKPEFYKDYFDFVFILSPNFERDDSWRHIDKLIALKEKKKAKTTFSIHERFIEEEMNGILSELGEAVEKLSPSKRKKILFLFDDIIEDVRLLNSSFLSTLFTKGRHLNASVWFSTQSYKSTPRKMRLQLTDVILFSPRNLTEKKMIYEEFISNMTMDEFDKLCNIVYAKPYKFLVIRPMETDQQKKYSLCYEQWIYK